MLQGNAGLKPKEGEITSRPWQWPINYRVSPADFGYPSWPANPLLSLLLRRVSSSRAAATASTCWAILSSGGAISSSCCSSSSSFSARPYASSVALVWQPLARHNRRRHRHLSPTSAAAAPPAAPSSVSPSWPPPLQLPPSHSRVWMEKPLPLSNANLCRLPHGYLWVGCFTIFPSGPWGVCSTSIITFRR